MTVGTLKPHFGTHPESNTGQTLGPFCNTSEHVSCQTLVKDLPTSTFNYRTPSTDGTLIDLGQRAIMTAPVTDTAVGLPLMILMYAAAVCCAAEVTTTSAHNHPPVEHE